MKRKTYQAKSLLQQRNQQTNDLFLLQSGSILAYNLYSHSEVKFNIDRLERGAILNARSFLVNDILDVNFECISPVSVFTLSLDYLKDIMTRRSDLLAVYKKEENELFHMKQNLGLDYIQ